MIVTRNRIRHVLTIVALLLTGSAAFAARLASQGPLRPPAVGGAARPLAPEALPATATDGAVPGAGREEANAPLPPGRLLPPRSGRHGGAYDMTFGEWLARDWEVFLAFSPFDPTVCVTGLTNLGTPAQVVHLNAAGTFNCTLTAEQSLLLPMWTFGAFSELDCAAGCSPAVLADVAASVVDPVSVLEAELDGEPLRYPDGKPVRWFRHRTVTPVYSPYAVPGNGLPLGGALQPAVADGYIGILTPLEPGSHTLRLHTVVGDPSAPVFELETTYLLTVTP
jgi:hypothetical protein